MPDLGGSPDSFKDKTCPGCGALVGEWHYPACTRHNRLLQGKRYSGDRRADMDRQRP